ncbi:hypothetical protein M378DRAFT_18875, partial [Amanita muscaria Koide BX008]
SYLASSPPSKSVKIPPFNFTVGNEGNPPNLAQRKGDIFTLTNRRIVCSKGTWFYDDNLTEVHRSEWWAEKGANERPPHSLVYKEKLYYEKCQIDYFPQARLWAYTDQATPQPLTDEDYEGVKPRTFQEFEQLAEKALPDEIVDEFIQNKRNLHKKKQQEAGSKGLQPSRTPSRRISPSTSQSGPIQSTSSLAPLIKQREAVVPKQLASTPVTTDNTTFPRTSTLPQLPPHGPQPQPQGERQPVQGPPHQQGNQGTGEGGPPDNGPEPENEVESDDEMANQPKFPGPESFKGERAFARGWLQECESYFATPESKMTEATDRSKIVFCLSKITEKAKEWKYEQLRKYELPNPANAQQ